MTDQTSDFSNAITTSGTFNNQVAKWDKLVKRTFLQAFPKFRHRKKKVPRG